MLLLGQSYDAKFDLQSSFPESNALKNFHKLEGYNKEHIEKINDLQAHKEK